MAEKTKKLTIKVREHLQNLVYEYGVHKTKADSLKKKCDAENSEIKEIMGEYNLSEIESGDYTAKLSISERETVDEDVLLEVAKKHQNIFNDIIKTKEYVDSDALEKAIYNNQIPNDILLELDKARTIKQIPTLRVSKNKEKKA